MRKYLSLLLALVLVLSLCGARADEEDRLGGLTLPLTDKELTITMFFGSQYEMTDQTYYFQKLHELTGIHVVPIVYTKDIASEKYANLLASADLPDIGISSYVGGMGNLNMYGDQGAFAAVNDYLDVMPNFKAIFIDDPENWFTYSSYASQTTGNLYTMPIYKLNRDVNFGFMYRADVFAELGIEPWTDTDSFVEALRAIKAAYPDSYPFSNNAGGVTSRFASYFDMNNVPYAYDFDTNQYYIACTDEKFRTLCDFMQMLMTEGLLDPEVLTHTVDSWTACMLNNKSFVTEQWIGRMALMNAQAAESIPGFDLVYGRPIGNGKAQELAAFSTWGAVVANSDHTEPVMKLIDFLYSEMGSELLSMGVEGEIWHYGDQGELVYPEIEGEVTINALEEKYGLWIEGLYLHPSRKSCYYTFTDHEQFAQDLINNECGYSRLCPTRYLDEDSQQRVDQLTTELRDKMNAFYASFITNPEAGDAEWNAWVESAMKNYGDELLTLLNS